MWPVPNAIVRFRQFMSLPNSRLGLPSFLTSTIVAHVSFPLPLCALSAFINLSRVSSVLHSESTPSVKLIRAGADGAEGGTAAGEQLVVKYMASILASGFMNLPGMHMESFLYYH